jgi:hypothetical protein
MSWCETTLTALLTIGLVCVGWVYGWDVSGHQDITRRAVAVLPPSEQDWLEPERALLENLYCGFPDMNWGNQGALGGWSSDPTEPRMPDTRREWEISFCLCQDPYLRTGHRYDHSPPDSYVAVPFYFRKAIDAARAGKHGDCVRFLGVAAHYIQDTGSFAHKQDIHRGIDFRAEGLAGLAYSPRLLGKTPDEACAALADRVKGLVVYIEAREKVIVQKRQAGQEWPDIPEGLECAAEAMRVTADLLHTAITIAPEKPPTPEVPIGTNLVMNPGFEENHGDMAPAHWAASWGDSRDRVGRAIYENLARVARNHDVTHTGRCSAKILWAPAAGIEWRQSWPCGVLVRPGQVYRASGRVRLRRATGKSFIAIEFCRADCRLVRRIATEPLSGEQDWKKVSVEATVPEGAVRARLICRSEANEGAAWFDDVELARVR